MSTRTDLTASLAIPPTGILLSDMQKALRLVTLQSFMAATPAPFLLQITPDQASEMPEGLQPRLTALHESKVPGWRLHHLVHKDRPLLVGRSKELCDVVLDDKTVSKRHAEFVKTPRGWRVIDLEAANGTWVETRRVHVGVPIPLDWGGLVRFSTYQTLLLPPQALFSLAVGLDPHGHSIRAGIGKIPPRGTPLRELLVRVDRLDRPLFEEYCNASFLLQIPNETELDEEVLDGDLPPGATRAISHSRILRLRRGKQVGMAWVHPLWPGKEALMLGRAHPADVVIADESASKQHAQLRYLAGSWQVTDLGSKNGTYVEGSRLESGLAHPLRFGQTLSFSSYRALFLGPQQILHLLKKTTKRL